MANTSPSAALTWEEIVERVCVRSNYLNLERAAGHWENIFGAQPSRGQAEAPPQGQLGQLHLALKKLMADSSANWHGAGAEAFRQHVNQLVTAVTQIHAGYRGLHKATVDSAAHLKYAVHEIDVPDWLYGRVREAQAAFQTTGAYSWWPPGNRPWLTDLIYRNNGHDAESAKYWSSWFSGYESAARRRYDELVTNYAADLRAVPRPAQVSIPGVGPGSENGPGNGPGNTRGPGQNAPNSAGLGSGLTGPQVPATTAGLNNNPSLPTTLPTTTIPDPSTVKLPGTDDLKLPGFSDPSTAGLAGLGAGLGGGGGLPGLGPGVGLPSTTSGFGAPGTGGRGLTLPGAGGPGAVNGMGGMYPPMYPPMGGAGHGAGAGQGGKTDCLLNEDEVKVMFGFETDGPDGCEPQEIPRSGVLEA